MSLAAPAAAADFPDSKPDGQQQVDDSWDDAGMDPRTLHASPDPARFLPGARLSDCVARDAIVAEGCYLDRCTIDQSVIGIRTHVQSGSRISRSVLLGADFYETDDLAPARGDNPRVGIGRDVVLDRVIVDKNARIGDGVHLRNAHGRADFDGDGYYIRNGIIVVPKDGAIKAGTVV